MRYLQWDTDGIYDGALILYTDEMRNADIYMLNKFWTFIPFPPHLSLKILIMSFFVMP